MRAPALALLLAGCATRLLDPSTESTPPPDAAVDEAAPGDLAGACASHALVEVPLTKLAFVDPLPLRQGMAIRVEADFTYRPGCDEPGALEVKAEKLGALGDHFTVAAHLWQGQGFATCGAPVTIRRVADLNVAMAEIVGPTSVRDHAAGSPLFVSTMVQPTTPSACQPPFGECNATCECRAHAADTSCIPGAGSDGGGGCLLSCSEDADCPDSQPRCAPGDRQPFVCFGSTCILPCPDGQACTPTSGGAGCRPVGDSVIDQACACDADCPAPFLCAPVPGTSDSDFRCQRPCQSPADCTDGTSCQDSRCAPLEG